MVGLAYASVPLYDLFCRITGFDGTPLVGSAPAAEILERTITVRFDANVAPGLDWRFTPEAPQIEVKLGETQTVFYKVRNAGRTATDRHRDLQRPAGAGRRAIFVKLQCFCFTEQTLKPGEDDRGRRRLLHRSGARPRPERAGPCRASRCPTPIFPARNGEPVATSSAAAAAPKL